MIVPDICKLFGASKQAYYKRDSLALQTRLLQEQIAVDYALSVREIDPGIGARKLYTMYCKESACEGKPIGRDHFFRLLQQRQMMLRVHRSIVPKTTDAKHNLPLYPNKVCVGDYETAIFLVGVSDTDKEKHHLSKGRSQPNVNRILVYSALAQLNRPVSLKDIENEMLNLDKSSIFRVLNLFEQHDVVHAFEDGRGIIHYELCHHDEGECNHTEGHLHFYCESCQQSFCLEDTPIPPIHLPEGFIPHSISFVVKGECPNCAGKH